MQLTNKLQKTNQQTLARNKSKNLKSLLTAATCSLLGTTGQVNAKAQSQTEENQWQFDTALMYYGETDRVTAVEGIIAATKEFDDEEFLSLKLTIDSLTGASANGAVAQPYVQTFARPSGKGTFDVPAGETPLDDTFKDTRVQVNASWAQPLTTDYTISTGLHASKEYDYVSLGLNASLTRDFNKKNTTVAVGFAAFYDEIEPEGGIPNPLAILPEPKTTAIDDRPRIGSSDNKTTIDVLLGLTQVINRRAIMQFNYSFSKVDGYLTDPFKIVSVVDDLGLVQNQIYEKRPDNRQKHSIFWQTKYHFTSTVVDFSYRYLWDDWEISSHTFELRYRIPFGTGYIEPHLRHYMQEAAEFYRPFIEQGDAYPSYVSADYRVGEMNAYTLGFKYGLPLKNGQELSFRIEYYQQDPENPGYDLPGVLQDVELFESVEALIVQINYSF